MKDWARTVLLVWGLVALWVVFTHGRGFQECLNRGKMANYVEPDSEIFTTDDSDQGEAAAAPRSVPALLQSIRLGEALAGETTFALSCLGPLAAPDLLTALADTNEQVRLVAVWAITSLARQLDPEVQAATVDALIRLVNDTNGEVRFAAVLALGFCGPSREKAIPALTTALQDPDLAPDGGALNVRATAARILGRIGPGAQAVIPELTRLSTDTNGYIRQQAEMALARIRVGS